MPKFNPTTQTNEDILRDVAFIAHKAEELQGALDRLIAQCRITKASGDATCMTFSWHTHFTEGHLTQDMMLIEAHLNRIGATLKAQMAYTHEDAVIEK